MAEVKTAQATIEEHWPEHAAHKSGTRHARWSTAEGIVCACGDVLGWPDPEHPETLAQYTKRVAQEQVDAGLATAGHTQGAFGTYPPGDTGSTDIANTRRELDEAYGTEPKRCWPAGTSDNPVDVRAPGDYPDPEVQEPEGLPAGDGRKAYDDLPYDVPEEDGPADDPWADTPPEEPDPEVLAVEPVAELASPPEELAARDDADEAQARPWSDAEEKYRVDNDLPPWEDADDQPGPPWAPDERTEAAEIEDGSQNEYSGGEVERRPEPSVGSAAVPYAGTPIMPTDAQELDPLRGRLAPLDPTLPYTPADVELKIVEILRQLENSELFLRQQLARLHQATHNYNMRYNLAYKTSDGRSDGQRKADAVLATERESYEMSEAEMLVRALRDSQHNLRSQLSGFQSVNRSLLASLGAPDMGGRSDLRR